MKIIKTKQIICWILACTAVLLGGINLVAINTTTYDSYAEKICNIEEYSNNEQVICQDNSVRLGTVYNEIRVAESVVLFSTAAILIVLSFDTKKKN